MAVKKLKTGVINRAKFEEFVKEMEIMEGMRHPNMVMFLGASTKPPNLCLIMEYCGKGCLWDLLHNPHIPLTWERRKIIALQTAKGVN